MSYRTQFGAIFLFVVLTLAMPGFAAIETNDPILKRLQALEENQARLESELQARDRRIASLENRLALTAADSNKLHSFSVISSEEKVASNQASVATTSDAKTNAAPAEDYWGRFQPGGGGYRIVNTPDGTVNFGAWTYVRYLNQKLLDKTYTDSFGREFKLDLRNDVQVNKVNLTFNGWFMNPDFRYLLYTWTSNTSQGEPAQVVVAGNLKYRIDKALDVGFGIDALPGTRSMAGTFPYFTKVDSRTMADEFFRPSYTTGVTAAGYLRDDLKYKAMLGNNLSQLGVNASRLDGQFSTFSGRIDWMPTTGEFGPNQGFGDFE
ncbi:MAG: hypothetical protein AAGF57_18995, partial [Pseudomonadota bacterium]